MITETVKRIKLIASKGMMLTNGTEYGKIVYLAEGAENNWYEITKKEYDEIVEAEERKYEA